MPKSKQNVIVLLMFTFLAGCATSPANKPILPPTPTDLANRELLAYHQQLLAISTADQAREVKRLGSAATNPANVMKLSLLLARSRSSADLGQAQSLLEAVLHNQGVDALPYHALARLILSPLINHRTALRKWEDQQADQKKLEEQVERQSQQLRDYLKKNELQAERLEILSAQLKSLTVKLEALKAIERSLSNRPTSTINGT